MYGCEDSCSKPRRALRIKLSWRPVFASSFLRAPQLRRLRSRSKTARLLGVQNNRWTDRSNYSRGLLFVRGLLLADVLAAELRGSPVSVFRPSLLAATMLAACRGDVGRSRDCQRRATSEILRLERAVVEYQRSTGYLPKSLHVLAPPACLAGCFLAEVNPDPWGTPYGMDMIGGTILIRSAGPDGVLGNNDDIVAPVLEVRQVR